MKIKPYLLIIGLLSVLSSCQVTDTVPLDSITDLNYWKTPNDMKAFANSLYTTLAGPTWNTAVWYDTDSDNELLNTPDPHLFNSMSIPASGGGWANADWKNIRDVNYVLTHYKTVVGAAADINHYLGEIRFFRANEYFNKVKTFGDVPWINKDLTTADNDILYAARTPMKQVIDSIIGDLEFAAANLKGPNAIETGRLHKYAALQMLARVCLYEGSYLKYRNITGWESYMTKAATTSEKIMNEGGYQIVKANTTYSFPGYPLYYKAQFITEDLLPNKECVLPRIFITNVVTNRQNDIGWQYGYGVTKDFIESFLCTDGKPIALSPLYQGDDSTWMEMANRDPRLRNMIDNKYLPFYLNGAALTSYPLSPVSISTCPTGYLLAKFRDPNPVAATVNMTSYDWNIFRYAEVLLIFAESKAELGTITQSDLDKSINLLRARLDEPGNFTMGRLSINPPADPLANVNGQPRYGYTISPLLYEIRRERRIELAFEGFRWDDIVRWAAGKLIENPKTMVGLVVNADVIARYKNYNKGIDQFAGRGLLTITDWDGKTKNLLKVYTASTRTWVDKLYFNPLPSDQLTLNSKLVQNPGW